MDSSDPTTECTAGDPLAARLRGFGLMGLVAIAHIIAANVLIAPLGSVLVLAWARLSRTPWRELGFAPARSWVRVSLIGIAVGVTFKLLLKMVVMPLLGAPTLNQAYHYLVGNALVLPGMLLAVTVAGGFGEETVFRGFLFERLRRVLGPRLPATAITLFLTTALFAVLHYPEQGLAGAEQATMTGLVFGGLYLATKQLWVPMIAHASFDITAVLIIYFDLETSFAHALLS